MVLKCISQTSELVGTAGVVNFFIVLCKDILQTNQNVFKQVDRQHVKGLISQQLLKMFLSGMVSYFEPMKKYIFYFI